MSISTKTRKTLWGRSGNRCAICKIELVHEKDPFNSTLNLGEECHIISQQNKGPRHVEIVDFDYDDSDNLLLLCSNHHTTIDEKVDSYPAELLKQIKRDHELWVRKNLESTTDNTIEPTREQQLLSFMSRKHDKSMAHKSLIQIQHSPETLSLAKLEIEKIINKIRSFVQKLNEITPGYQVIVRDNEQNMVDVIFNRHTLLVQFYQPHFDSAVESYLLFATFSGLFNSQGYADPFYPPHREELIRLKLAKNGRGELGWLDNEDRESFYKTEDITDIWLEKFFHFASPDEEENLTSEWD